MTPGSCATCQPRPVGEDAVNLHIETSSPVGGADADLKGVLDGEVICQLAGPTSFEQRNFLTPAAGTYTANVNAHLVLSNYTILGRFTAPVDVIFPKVSRIPE